MVNKSRHAEQVFQRKGEHAERCLQGITAFAWALSASTEEEVDNQIFFEAVFKEQWG